MPHWSDFATGFIDSITKTVEDFTAKVEDAFSEPAPKPTAEVQEGDWVLVYGKVTKVRTGLAEVVVRFESHNEHYEGAITLRHLDSVVSPPPDTPQCSHLFGGSGGLIRCNQAAEHAGNHTGVSLVGSKPSWGSGESSGYMEDR